MTKLMMVFTMVAAAALVAPQPVAAGEIYEDGGEGSCTEEYMLCIAEAGLLEEPFRTMQDIECGGEWVACVGRKIIFW